MYDQNVGQFVFSARPWKSSLHVQPVSSYMCQLQQGLTFSYAASSYWSALNTFYFYEELLSLIAKNSWKCCSVTNSNGFIINVKRIAASGRHEQYSVFVYKITGASCDAGDLSLNSKCYRKFHNSSSLTWFSASNDCLSRGGSLAVFTDIGQPFQNSQLVDWLSTSDTYWIGLIKSWWKTTSEGRFELFR